jgi:phosphoenolpyruvate carboxylase
MRCDTIGGAVFRSWRLSDETWRQFVALMPIVRQIASKVESYADARELIDDLRVLFDALVAVGAPRIADEAVAPVIRLVQTFGFHLAALDVRQNSRFHDLALGQLLAASGEAASNFAEWDRPRRLALLERERLRASLRGAGCLLTGRRRCRRAARRRRTPPVFGDQLCTHRLDDP